MAAEHDSVGEIGLDLVINQNNFDRQLNGIQSIAKKAGKTLAAAFAVKKIADFGKSCLDLGSDLAEVQNVVDVTFANMNKQVDKFAKNAITQFGLSETMAKRYTGTFGAMAKAFGFGEQTAYDMATALTGLAGDVASFYNISQDEAYTKLKSVFTGETESLKDLGVVMTQTALDSFALANGFGKTTAKMSEAEKVALRYQFVQNQLTAAAGDFARTSGSWANQIRILSLQFDSLKASIGQGLISALTPVIQVINTVISRLVTLADYFRAFMAALFGNAGEDTTASMAKNMAAAASSAGAAAKAADRVKKSLGASTGIDELNILKDTEDNSGTDAAGGDAAGIAPIEFGEGITLPEVDTSGVEAAAERIKAIFRGLRKFLEENRGEILAIIGGLTTGIAAYFAVSNWESITSGLMAAFSGIATKLLEAFASLNPAALVIAAVVGVIAAGIIDLWNTSDTFRENMKKCWAMISQAFSEAWSTIWNLGLQPLGQALTDLAKTLKRFYDESGLKTLFEIIITAIAAIVSYITSTVMTVIGVLVALILGAVTTVITLFTDLLNTVLWVKDNWIEIWDGIRTYFENLWSTFCELVVNAASAIVTAVSNGWNAISTATVNVWNNIATYFNKKWTSMKQIASNALDHIRTTISSTWITIQTTWMTVWNAIKDFFVQLWESIKLLISETLEAIRTGISGALDTISQNWIDVWTTLKDTTGKIFEKMWETIKGIINSIINGVEKMVNSVIKGINKMIEAINEVADKVPGVSRDLIPTIPELNLPRLANGGFVRANTPQLAMIGDNRHYGEIVAPEDKMQEMVDRAVAMASGSGMSDQYLIVMIDLLKEIISLIEAMDLTVKIDVRDIKKKLVELDKRSGYTLRTT